MPTYAYECSHCECVFQEHWDLFKEANPYLRNYECPQCGKEADRNLGLENTAIAFKGFFPGQRIKQVDARKKRQELRLEEKVKKKEMTKQDVANTAKIRDKYAKTSPYTYDPQKAKAHRRENKPDVFDDKIDM